MTHVNQRQQRRVEGAKSRMSTAAAMMAGVVFGVIVLGIVLYLVLR